MRLLDLGFFRVGGEVYAEENESFGLATVRREHVSVKEGEVVFDFPGQERPAPHPVDSRSGGEAGDRGDAQPPQRA